MRLLLAGFFVAATVLSASADAAQEYVALEQRLDAEQMHATGLDTLSSAQLALLNNLLSQDQGAAVDAAVADRTAQAGLREKRPPAEALSASVQGDVRAWSRGDTVLLDNGQRWRVIDGNLYLGKPVSNPQVTIAPGFLGAWYMEMEGQAPRVKVQRVY